MDNFRFYLQLQNEPSSRIEITEPLKWDTASFSVQQRSPGYGRDISYGNKEVSLEFVDGYYEKSPTQIQLPNGIIIDNLTMGLPFLLEADIRFGFETIFDFIISKNGLDFDTGNLDFQTRETDTYSYMRCKIIKNNTLAKISRKIDTNVNVFSDKDLEGNLIAPVATTNILIKAKPSVKISEWVCEDETVQYAKGFSGAPTFFNVIKTPIKDDIANSLSWLEDYDEAPFPTTNYPFPPDFFRVIKAKYNLTNLKADIRLKMTSEWVDIDGEVDGNFEIVGRIVRCQEGNFFDVLAGGDSPDNIKFYDSNGLGPGSGIYSYSIDQQLQIDLPNMVVGDLLCIVFLHRGSNADQFSKNTFHKASIQITATETAISSVVKGVRYIDFIKQIVKSINGMPIIAPRFDVGGQFYDQFVYNGNLIRQRIDTPFYGTFKQEAEDLSEVNADYQINDNEIFLGQEMDFYPNRELLAIPRQPDSDFKTPYNPRHTINLFEFGYKKYEQSDDAKNTIDGVHTEGQWQPPNQQVENAKRIKINHNRDPFLKENVRRKNVGETSSTAIQEDNEIFIDDVVQISPGTYLTEDILLIHSVGETGNLTVMNDGGFNWNLIGFEVGNVVSFLNTLNVGNYNVIEIGDNIIKLEPIGFSPTFNGEVATKFKYPLANVLYKNRTDEGFTLIQGLAEPENFSNLLYTPRRNIVHFEDYLATCCLFQPLKSILCTYFKNNGNLTTQFLGGKIYTENEQIPVSSLPVPTLSPRLVNLKTIAEFEEVYQLVMALKTIFPDGTVGGFIRTQDPKGKMLKLHPIKLDYVWSTKVLTISGELRYERPFIKINSVGQKLIEINEVGYDVKVLNNASVRMIGNYISLLDARAIPLIVPTRIDRIAVNGTAYTTKTELATALMNM